MLGTGTRPLPAPADAPRPAHFAPAGEGTAPAPPAAKPLPAAPRRPRSTAVPRGAKRPAWCERGARRTPARQPPPETRQHRAPVPGRGGLCPRRCLRASWPLPNPPRPRCHRAGGSGQRGATGQSMPCPSRSAVGRKRRRSRGWRAGPAAMPDPRLRSPGAPHAARARPCPRRGGGAALEPAHSPRAPSGHAGRPPRQDRPLPTARTDPPAPPASAAESTGEPPAPRVPLGDVPGSVPPRSRGARGKRHRLGQGPAPAGGMGGSAVAAPPPSLGQQPPGAGGARGTILPRCREPQPSSGPAGVPAPRHRSR